MKAYVHFYACMNKMLLGMMLNFAIILVMVSMATWFLWCNHRNLIHHDLIRGRWWLRLQSDGHTFSVTRVQK